ncbi:uncharacterized protein RSE6_12338 [Rhynchosporium secalis]|uniref:Uncharacterized protein n=1 Tax=Rhynchosporium secalis TaxID=38038 RepID=A0A1E1MQ53_RHYSE|nr:uncharacterized protein RSE6_12338 [Rhynchosporium secalis]
MSLRITSQVVSVGNPDYNALLDLKTKSNEIHHEVCLLHQSFVPTGEKPAMRDLRPRVSPSHAKSTSKDERVNDRIAHRAVALTPLGQTPRLEESLL